MSESRYLFFDTETTGISNSSHLVQLAWILTDENGKRIEEGNEIVKPIGYEIPSDASKVHGITTDYANKYGVSLVYVLDKFSQSARKANLLIAHNIQFDYKVMTREYHRTGKYNAIDGINKFCTMRTTTNWCKLSKLNGRSEYKWPKLEELHFKLFQRDYDNKHDALADTAACMECFFELIERKIIVLPNIHPQEVEKLNFDKIQNKTLEELGAEQRQNPSPTPKSEPTSNYQKAKELNWDKILKKVLEELGADLRKNKTPPPKEEPTSNFKNSASFIPNRPGVYSIVNLVNGRQYIGSSYSMATRIRSHINKLKKGCHDNHILQHDYNTFGEEKFEAKMLIKLSSKDDIKYFEKCNINSLLESNVMLYNTNIDNVK